MKIFHIRQKKPNHRKTLCGEPTTSHDDRYSWQALPCGKYEPCPKCLALKDEAESLKASPKVAAQVS